MIWPLNFLKHLIIWFTCNIRFQIYDYNLNLFKISLQLKLREEKVMKEKKFTAFHISNVFI